MALIKCFTCGKMNSDENSACQDCGSALLRGPAYQEHIRELKAYNDYRNRYNLVGIILASFSLLLGLLACQWLLRITAPFLKTDILPLLATAFRKLGLVGQLDPETDIIPLIATALYLLFLLAFLLQIFPMIAARWKIFHRYCWTREEMHSLDHHLECLRGDSGTKIYNDDGLASVRRAHGPSPLVVVLTFAIVGLVSFHQFDGFPLVDHESSPGISATPINGPASSDTQSAAPRITRNQPTTSGTQGDTPRVAGNGTNTPDTKNVAVNASAQQVKGKYEHTYQSGGLSNPSRDDAMSGWSLTNGGAIKPASSQQTWAYVFTLGPDGIHGTFKVYLNGSLQYNGQSGEWYQVGNVLYMAYPAIPDLGISSRNSSYKVNNDGTVIYMGDAEYRRTSS